MEMQMKLGKPNDENRRIVVVDLNENVIQKEIDDFEEVSKAEADQENMLKEKLLKKVFLIPVFDNVQSVLMQVTLLNSFYNTQIKNMNLVAVAKRIVDLNAKYKIKEHGIVEHLLFRETDPEKYRQLVNLIAYSKEFDNTGNYYSFASKYCSWYVQNRFPIVDSFSKGFIFRATEGFKIGNRTVIPNDLNDYHVFCQLYDHFVMHLREDIGIHYTYKQVDEFIWNYSARTFNALNIMKADESKDSAYKNGSATRFPFITNKDREAIEDLINKEHAKEKARKDAKVKTDYYQKEIVDQFVINPDYNNSEEILKSTMKKLKLL